MRSQHRSGKQRPHALIGLPGVRGDSARGKNQQEAGPTILDWAIRASRFGRSITSCGAAWDNTCADAASVAGVPGKVLACTLTSNIWAWWRCECLFGHPFRYLCVIVPGNVRNSPDLVTAKLPDLHVYQLAIPAPKPPAGSFDAVAAARGKADSLVDPLLEKLAGQGGKEADVARKVRGHVAIASARMAYQIYKEIFQSERFQKLADQGARLQRLLWASTGTKNPDYS